MAGILRSGCLTTTTGDGWRAGKITATGGPHGELKESWGQARAAVARPNTTSPGVSAEHNLGFAGAGEGRGYYISDNPGNGGGCIAGKIDPISFSQGIWDLSPGQFQGGNG